MLASHASGYLGVAEWLRGRLADAERALLSTIGRWRAAGERYLAVRGCHHLGQVQRAQGRLDAALETYRLALEIAAAPDRPILPATGIGHVGVAEVAYQRGELEAALEHVVEGIGRCRQLAYTQPLATGLATLAWIRQAEGNRSGAVDAIEEAGRVAAGPGMTTLLNPVPAQRARLLLAQGDLDAAARWTRERGLAAGQAAGYPREPEQLVLARVLLAQDRPGQALGLLERLLAAAAQSRIGSVIEIQGLRALAQAAGGDEAGAVASLAEALTLACPEGYVRVFADEGAPMRALVGRLVAAQRSGQPATRGVPLDCLARLLRAFDPTQARRGSAGVPGLAEPLTTRELEVLELLAAGRSNQRIAQELVVSLDTVKKHVSRVLDKLGAANRTEAVARARALGLLG
jgi:LuxR family maltose regulon positive regulatory protein